MLKFKQKRGLAWSAITALLMTTFAVLTPAANASESSAVLSPTGAGTGTTMVITETMEMRLRYGTSVAGADNSAASSGSGTIATNPSVHVSADSLSADIIFSIDGDGDFSTGATRTDLNSISATAATDGYASVTSTSAFVSFGLAGLTSVSPAVALTVTPFLDIDGTAGLSGGDAVGTAVVINFVPWATAFGASAEIEAPVAGDVGATVSVAVTAGSLNWQQLDGSLGVAIDSTYDVSTGNSGTISAQATGAASPDETLTGTEMVAGDYSFSAVALTAPFTTSARVESVSAKLVYFASVPNHDDDVTGGQVLKVASTVGVSSLAVAATTISPATAANIKRTGANSADARFNSAFSLTAYPYSASATTSIAVASAMTVSFVGSGMEFDADSGVILNGVTYTSSAAFAAAGFTLPAGVTSVPVSTFGQDEDGANDAFTLSLTAQLKTTTLEVTLKTPSLSVAYGPTAVAGLAGASKTFAVDVTDQWSQIPARTDLRVAASVVLGGSTSDTVAATVTAGEASVTVTPVPAARTGSAVVTLTLQKFNQDTQAWDNVSTDTATWNVYTYVDATNAITSRTASTSASISYGVNLSYSGTIAVGVANSFSDVVVTAPGLIIQNADQTSITASDTLTVAANGLTANFKFTSRLAGTYTVTFANGATSTTSTVIITPATHDAGATLTFDKAAIGAGETTTITGTLLDINGNPVATGNTASVAVAWSGKGLAYGNSTTMQTDADGQLSFQVLVLSGESGDAAIAATYKPAGLAVDTDNVSVVHAVSVGTAAAATPANAKLTVGSFKGFVAIYALNYTGQKLSAKVAGKWLVEDNLARYERIVRNTGAGYTINVELYIDGAFVRTEVITTK